MPDIIDTLQGLRSVRSYAEPDLDEDIDLEDDPELEAIVEALDELEDEGEEVHAYASPEDMAVLKSKALAAQHVYDSRRKGLTLAPSKHNPRVRRWIRATAIKHAAKRSAVSGVPAAILSTAFGPVGAAVGAAAGATAEKVHAKTVHSPGHYEYWMKHHGDYVAQKAKEHGVSKRTVASALAAHGSAAAYRHIGRVGQKHWEEYGSLSSSHNSWHSVNKHHARIAAVAKRSFERKLKQVAAG